MFALGFFREKIKKNRRIFPQWISIIFLSILASGILSHGCSLRDTRQSNNGSGVYKIVIPEGFTVEDIAARVEFSSKGRITRDEFLNVARSSHFDHWFLKGTNGNLEGFLFPKTYEVMANATAKSVVKKLLDQFEKETSAIDWGRAKSLGVTPYQAVIVASLIEREVRVPWERELVSSVIYNRLSKGMKLEIDATVQYALKTWKRELSYDDLKIDSPYNTYKIQGLPPSPICNPGFESIRAALYPANTDYLFYVLTDPVKGTHSFTADYQQFLRWKREAGM